MRKRDVAVLTFLSIFSLFLVFCWLFHWFRWSNDLISSVGDIFVRVLAWLNLMDYQSHIGGHHAHLHGLIWWANLLLALIYAGTAAYLVRKRMKLQRKILTFSIFVFLTSFAIYSITTFHFFFELERFAYSFFVPQV